MGRQTTNISNLDVNRFKEIELPAFDFDEQRRIAAILDKADAIRRKRGQALSLADDFLRSVFLEMFGDPAADGTNIKRRALSELGQIDTGKTPPTNNPENYGSDIPFVTPGDLGGSIVESRRTISRLGAKYTKIVQPGATLVCCIGATIGKMGFLTRPAAFNQQINAITWGPLIDPIFGHIGLTFLAKKIADSGTSTTLPILNKSQFSQIMFPVPELPKQRQFAVQVTKLWEIANRMQTQSHDANGLFRSLTQRAFAGDL
jgi:type I restriction enzyme S subunit